MKNILLIGLGRFGRHIALQLNKLGHEVMAVDSNEERVNEILPISLKYSKVWGTPITMPFILTGCITMVPVGTMKE